MISNHGIERKLVSEENTFYGCIRWLGKESHFHYFAKLYIEFYVHFN